MVWCIPRSSIREATAMRGEVRKGANLGIRMAGGKELMNVDVIVSGK